MTTHKPKYILFDTVKNQFFTGSTLLEVCMNAGVVFRNRSWELPGTRKSGAKWLDAAPHEEYLNSAADDAIKGLCYDCGFELYGVQK